MTDTLIASDTAADDTASSADDVKTDDATPTADDAKAEGDKSDVVDKMYDKTPDKDDPTGDDAKADDGDKKGQDEGDDKKSDDADAKDDSDKEGDDKKKDGDKEGDDEGDEPGEPLDLSDMEFDLPEGMELNKEVLGDLGELAGELGIKDKEQAAKFVPLGVKLVENAFAKQQEQFAETRKEWVDTVANDKEIGGADEKARKEKLVVADRGLAAVGTPELRTLLNQTGLGDNPEVIRAFYKVGLGVSEDVVERGGSGDTAPGGLDAMYPTMAEKK